ncbi:hypothetical protein P879_07092 [Paragonimus westermani]|uniref:Uncharacterized protein n=1 Tax=Paragonimus westermani TaxID=34504 RepID=A0A8T0DJ09_9TREM|nr:hypothetical protein P879_07092 [Paragonimus westermani]
MAFGGGEFTIGVCGTSDSMLCFRILILLCVHVWHFRYRVLPRLSRALMFVDMFWLLACGFGEFDREAFFLLVCFMSVLVTRMEFMWGSCWVLDTRIL